MTNNVITYVKKFQRLCAEDENNQYLRLVRPATLAYSTTSTTIICTLRINKHSKYCITMLHGEEQTENDRRMIVQQGKHASWQQEWNQNGYQTETKKSSS